MIVTWLCPCMYTNMHTCLCLLSSLTAASATSDTQGYFPYCHFTETGFGYCIRLFWFSPPQLIPARRHICHPRLRNTIFYHCYIWLLLIIMPLHKDHIHVDANLRWEQLSVFIFSRNNICVLFSPDVIYVSAPAWLSPTPPPLLAITVLSFSCWSGLSSLLLLHRIAARPPPLTIPTI